MPVVKDVFSVYWFKQVSSTREVVPISSNPRAASFGQIVGASPRIQKAFTLIEKAAKTDLPVLIVGETGTGKELAAQEIHRRSERAKGPFVPVNTGALPRDLIASELFGHSKGAFTGANSNKLGRFREADSGTLFLDEIGTMEDRVQVALLRVLETETFRPVGATKDEEVNVRLIAATNEDPHELVQAGNFREDLWFRFEVMRIDLPPLREIPEDIPILVDYFIGTFADKFDTNVSGVEQKTLEVLSRYAWPGNIRELKNVIAQSCVMAEQGNIKPEHLPNRILDAEPVESDVDGPVGDPEESAAAEDSTTLASRLNELIDEADALDGVFVPLGSSLEEVQKVYVLKTLAYCDNNKTQAAKLLGVSRKTLYDRLERWGYQG